MVNGAPNFDIQLVQSGLLCGIIVSDPVVCVA